MPPEDQADQTGQQAQQPSNERTQPQTAGGPDGPPPESRFSAWFASTVVRTGIALIGFILLLFALGQAVGFDLLGLFADAVTSQTGRWLVVAFFALLLIAAAHRGIRWNRQRM